MTPKGLAASGLVGAVTYFLLMEHRQHPALTLWTGAISAVMGIVMGKIVFGGLGHDKFNPALVGRAFLQAAFPVQMTTFYGGCGYPRRTNRSKTDGNRCLMSTRTPNNTISSTRNCIPLTQPMSTQIPWISDTQTKSWSWSWQMLQTGRPNRRVPVDIRQKRQRQSWCSRGLFSMCASCIQKLAESIARPTRLVSSAGQPVGRIGALKNGTYPLSKRRSTL